MQKSAIFINKKLPNLNGGLNACILLVVCIAAMFPRQSVALVNDSRCKDCRGTECAAYDYSIDATCCIRCLGDGNDTSSSVVGGGGGGGSGSGSGNIGGGASCAATACINYTLLNSATLNGCTTASLTCYTGSGGTYGFNSCTTCQSGWKKETRNITVPGCGPFPYTECKDCNKPASCVDGSWTDVSGATYQSKRIANWNSNLCSCSYTTQYRCKNGYYGSGTNCSPCTSPGTSDAGSNTSISGCYVTSGSDTSGTYTYISKCYWG